MVEQKVFVNKDMTSSMKCPLCGNIKTFDVGKFKGKGNSIKVKCSCETVFPVTIDFRKSYRKYVKLPGHYSKLPHSGTWSNMNVVNLSLVGVAINPVGGHNVSIDDHLKVKFMLDDPDRSLIEKNVRVANIKDGQIGCEFSDPLIGNKILGTYLLS